ncbi:MAG: hypothetical protein WCJ37_04685 [Syntrophus sp. (in: bacteria)]
MYECRCPHDGKKLAEIARPTLALQNYYYPCECGRWIRGQIVVEEGTENILALDSCPCGRSTKRVVGYVLTIQCSKCKAFINF